MALVPVAVVTAGDVGGRRTTSNVLDLPQSAPRRPRYNVPMLCDGAH
jgi:hypothetical protein